MNFTENFENFASRLTTYDLLLYGGFGLIIWVLFQDNLKPLVNTIYTKLLELLKTSKTKVSSVVTDVGSQPKVLTDDSFFELVAAWKQTRDLAVKNKRKDAVTLLDQVFPHLSPCEDTTGNI